MANYRKWDFLIFTLLTLLAVLNGQTTVFYLVYFFWWNELIRIMIDHLFYKQNPNAIIENGKPAPLIISLFQMGIYLIFIVVFFGVIANWGQQEIMFINVKILFFQNWFFNINLLFLILERIYLHKSHQPIQVYFGIFTPNMIVLHISIILGGILMFFVVKNFPEIFTPDHLWGSVVIVLPFLLLKFIIRRL